MSAPEKFLPINPQVLLKNKNSQKRKRRKRSKAAKTPNVPSIGEDSPAVEVVQTAPVAPSKDMEELKNDIQKKGILSNLSKEVAEEESVEKTMKTAKELKKTKPKQLPTEPKEKMKEREVALDEITQAIKVFKTKFAKLHKKVDIWNVKYRKRIVDMNLDVRSYEKKVKKKMNIEKSRVAELEAVAENNMQQRLWIERKLAKMILENPEKTLVTSLIEVGFNMVQSVLWILAVIRDFFRKR